MKTQDIEHHINHARTLTLITADGLNAAGTISEIEAWRDIMRKSSEVVIDELDRASRLLKKAGETYGVLEAPQVKDKSEWVTLEDKPPTMKGWYPVLVCYDANEGAFPDAASWDGKSFGVTVMGPLMMYIPKAFDNGDDARRYAKENDPGW